MSEEEKKAVEDIKGFLKEYLEKGFFGIIKIERMNNLKILLNLIEKQSKQLEEQINRKLDVENQKLFDDNFIMDRMINKMSEEIRRYWDSKDEYKNFGTRQIKEYFRKIVGRDYV